MPDACADEDYNRVQALLSDCSSERNSRPRLYCVAYVGGVADLMAVNGSIAKETGLPIPLKMASTCFTTPPTYGAYVRAFVNWAQTHPEHWQVSRTFGVMQALSTTWPCS
ncbi:hypothetical protein LB513_21290 [Mesorhizobium sp. ES1-1]|nr:hypothetical protein [Mesorhizobium sp. ES1-1]